MSRIATGLVVAVGLMACCYHLRADVIQQAPDTDFLVVEAEAYDSLEGDEVTGFIEVDTTGTVETSFGSQVLPEDSNVSGTALYDQPDFDPIDTFTDLATWKLQFATPGTYTLYMRYSMFEDQNETSYGNEDSFFFPLELNEFPEQDGWFTFPKLEHNDPLEDPPFWEGQFRWGPPLMFNNGLPIEYVVHPGDVGDVLDFTISTRERGGTLDTIIFSTDPDLSEEELDELFTTGQVCWLEAGDADQDWDFDHLDLIQVQTANRYRRGPPASWAEGDWNGAPGHGPPPGDNQFDHLDILAAVGTGNYQTGKYCVDNEHFRARRVRGAREALVPNGDTGDDQTSIVYDARTGEVQVNSPIGIELTSISIDSAAGIFKGEPARDLGGSFDIDTDTNIFKVTFGSSFGRMNFGSVATAGLAEEVVLRDLTAVGSLAGGGALGDVDLVYIPIPEPASVVLACLSLVAALLVRLEARP